MTKSPLSLEKRSSGVLLHLSSLPSSYGIGDLGVEAYRFADFLHQARQTWWQMFPLGPPGMSNSPYQVLSAFAGNPLFIDLERLLSAGLLSKSDMQLSNVFAHGRVDFDTVWHFKKSLFRKAFTTLETKKRREKNNFESFCDLQKFWLDDYALFCALKEKFGGVSWTQWDLEFRNRKPSALARARRELRFLVRYHQFLQFQFFTHWNALKKSCERKKIGLIGDIPIFVAHDSADVWAHPNLFWLDKSGRPVYVAGVPPDYFSRTGQRWGNPLYRWDVLKSRGYDWWVRRFGSTFQLFDAVRLDHFIGFHNYWRIPAGDKTAVNGRWALGPGAHFFETVFRKLGKLPVIAEDLGALTKDVMDLRDRFELPGMRVLQFAFTEASKENPFLPHNFSRRSVVYTGTHDNDTTVGWFAEQNRRARKFVMNYMDTDGKEIHWDMIRLALSSVAGTAIIPVQDLLGLGSRSRMNRPGTPTGNWTWRLKPNALTSAIAKRLSLLTETYGRS